MKSNHKNLFWRLFVVLACSLALFPLLYGQNGAAVQPIQQTETSALPDLILGALAVLAQKYPWVATIITILGSMRLWAKPLFSLIHTIVDLTPTKTDDTMWAKVHSFLTDTAIGKSLSYLLDWIGSIKVTPPAPKPEVQPATPPQP